ncbi:trypsin-like peptidase domain-containing protein [bacterium]|nr:trypsin-like peptidase domain-containing protein [bacterium]
MAATAGEPEEEYPSKDDLIKAGVVALITGLLGFVVTYSVFVRPYRQGKSLAGLDRHAAESSQPAAYRQSDQGAAGYAVAYTSAGGTTYEQRKSKLEIQTPERKAPVPQEDARPQATPTPQPTSLPLPGSAYQQRQSHLQVHAPQSQLPSVDAQTVPPPRPSETSFSEAWQRASAGWITLGDGLHTGGQGVQVSETQILTTLSAFRSGGGMCMLNGQRVSVQMVASDSRQDLALLQIQGSSPGTPVPLSPDVISVDQTYVCGDQRNFGRTLELRGRGLTGPCGAFDGFTGAIDGGAPIINNRGEMVALALPRPPWPGMSWNTAIPSSACQAFINAHPAGGGSPPPVSDMWVQAIRSKVTAQSERETPNRSNARIIAGQALGNYPLGLSQAQLQKELGQGQILEQKGAFCRILYSAPRLTFTLAEGMVVAIETDYNFYTLEGGLAVGSVKEPSELRGQFSPAVTYDTGALESLASPGLEILFNNCSIATIRVVPQ